MSESWVAGLAVVWAVILIIPAIIVAFILAALFRAIKHPEPYWLCFILSWVVLHYGWLFYQHIQSRLHR